MREVLALVPTREAARVPLPAGLRPGGGRRVRAGGAGNFREAGDHAADLPQEVLARLGGKVHPLLRRIVAPSETRTAP